MYQTEYMGRFELAGEEPLLTDWVSGKIRLISGEIVKYVHMVYFSSFEHEIVLNPKKGRVVRVVEETENIIMEEIQIP